MNNKFGFSALIVAFIMLLAACGGEKYEAHAINEDTDVCVICKMAIKDDQFATQIVTKDGQSLKFDDIGCLNTWKTENGTDTIGAAFVRDFNSKQWIRYEKAYYAYDSSYQTPMAYGIVSFEMEEDARAFIAEHGAGAFMTADDLAGHSWAVNHDMMNMDGHDHGDAEGHGDGHGDMEDQEHDAGDNDPKSGGHAS